MLVDLRFIIATRSPVVVGLVATKVMGWNPIMRARANLVAVERGLGPATVEGIEMDGNSHRGRD